VPNNDNIRLDGDPSGLIQALDRAVTAWNNYNKALEINARAMNLNLEATKEVTTLLRDYSAGARAAANQQQRLNRSVATGKKQMDSASRSTKKLASDTATAKAKADALSAAFTRTSAKAKQANSNVLQLGVSLSGMARLVGVQLIHRAISGLARALVEGARQSIELQKGLAEVRTISQDNQLSLDQWLTGVRALSNAYGVDLKDQVEATYQALSNQIAEGAETFTFLADANDFAAAAVTSTSDAVNLLTGALNAYGLGADQTQRVSAQFFKTIELGRVRASEMANSFGDIAIVAQQLGIQLDEVQAAVSTLTIRGVAYNKAATQLRGIFVKLLKPTEQMKEFFREIGVESGEAAIRTYGFDGVLQRLQNSTKGSATELAKYINRVRGLSGALALSNEGLDTYRKNLDEIRNSTDSYGEAVDEVLNNSGKRAEIFLETVKNKFLTAGSYLVEFYTELFDANTNFFNEAERQRKQLHRREAITRDLDNINKAYDDAVQVRTRMYEQEVAEFRAAMNKQVDAAVEGYEAIKDEASTTGGILIDSISDSISKASANVNRLAKEIEDANKRIIDLIRDEDQTLFEWSQDTRNTAEQISAITQRIAEQQAKRDQALRENNKKALDEYNKEILKLIKERKTLDDQLSKENIKSLQEEKKLTEEIAKAKRDSALKVARLQEQISGVKPGKGSADKRRELERKIFEEVRKTQEKVADLQKKQSEITILEQRKLQHAKELTAEIDKQKKGYEQIASQNLVIIDQERQKIVEQELLKEELKSLVKEFKGFDVGEAARETDPDKLKKIIAERQALAERLAQFQKDTGVRSKGLLGIGDAATKETQILIDALKVLEQVEERRKKIEELQKKQEGFKKQIEAQKEQGKELFKLKNAYEDVKDALQSLSTTEFTPEFQKVLDTLTADLKKFFDETGRVKDAQGAFDALNKAFTPILNARGNKIIQPLSQVMGELRVQVNRVRKSGDDFNIALGEWNSKLFDAKKEIENLRQANARLLAESKKQLVVEDQKKLKTENLIRTQERLLQILRDQTRELEKQGGPVAPNGAPVQQAFGDVMRGHDNMLALRQAGEAVINPKSTRKFYSQLVAMNSTPQSVVTGPSGGTTIGDINVTMNASGNLSYDAATLGREIKKAARRGLV